MTKDLVFKRIAAIVSALGETTQLEKALLKAGTKSLDYTGTPESMLYIFCDMNMEDYSIIRNVLLRAGLIQIKANYVTLTAKGIATAKHLNDAIKAGQK